ncbi:hypothetical protein FPOA_11942 [Fusarium poae]|uniref:BED-type domain-containing protein n=1 Tax=Fusarium poae TaxID=36050 RepID=A0A1B8AAZ7_FUSPO|nr:hypothetical protein FPOA_11942 [Fusarium poae]
MRKISFWCTSGGPRPNDLDGILIEPDEFKLNGKQYVRYVVVAKSQKHTKKRTSVVWQYGEDIQLKQDLTKRFWYCYLCEQQQRQQGLPISGKGNCTALDHLESKHQIDRETGERRHAKRHPSQPSIVDFNNISTLVFKRRFDEFKELLIRWIVYCHIAFFQIENLYFRELLFYIFPGLTTLLPKARLVVRRWIIEAFEARKDSLRQEMQTAHSNISISFDIWTSPNYQAILGCVAHFINRSGKRRTVVLALRELVGEHSGENMADVLLHIFDDYGISGRIGYFMADNASSNDACIDLVLKALYPNMSRKHRVRRRLRCFGHIVNLCAQAFIMGKDAAKTCKDLDSAYREGDYQAFYPYATNPRFSSGDVQERMARKRKTTANTWAHAREPLNSEPSRCGRKNEKIYYCMHCIHGIELEAHEHPIKKRRDRLIQDAFAKAGDMHAAK